MSFTRKSHIVRIGPSKDQYVDIEVLDAVSFRTDNGDEMVLNIPAANAKPYIVDRTGGGNGKTPGSATATRRSHMERITNPSDGSQVLDVEVLDALAFRDKNGDEWVMDMQAPGSSYNTTTNTGDIRSTRRVHTEKIYSDPKDPTSSFMTVERCDTMAFRGPNGKEVVIKMPSCDDGKQGPRASTFATPESYVPNGDVVPPANKDPGVYASFPQNSKGAFTGDAKIKMGPLWWPRGMSQKSGPWYWYIPVQTPYAFSLIADPCGQYIWVGNPSDSSFASIPMVLCWKRETALLTQPQPNPDCRVDTHVFQPQGFGSLDDAILHGRSASDWGLFGNADNRIDSSQPNGLNPNYSDLSKGFDNWQLANTSPPPLVKPVAPSIKWTAGAVTPEDYSRLANAFLAAWNGTSDAFNSEMAAAAICLTNEWWYITWPDGKIQRFGNGTDPSRINFPTTDFGVPLPNPWIGRNWGYVGGLPGNYYGDGSGTVNVSQGAYASYLGMSQLDQKKWDTTNPGAPTLRPSAA